MPEKLPPFYRQNEPQNSSSLILQYEHQPYNAKHLSVLIRLFKKLSFAILIIFSLLLGVNSFLNLKLESQRILLNEMADRVGNYSAVKKRTIELDKRIKFYEKTRTERNLMGDRSAVVFANLSDDTLLNSVVITPEKFSLDITVASPIHFAKLAARYLQTDLVSSITLKSAEFHPSKHEYNIMLEGAFKNE